MNMKPNKDFCVFILTHARPDKVITYNTLRKAGYTGNIYIIIDDEDKTADKYYDNFGKENVIMFNKKEIAKTFDEFDNFEDRRTIVYARNFCFEAANKLGYKYFIQLDDDYTAFDFRIDTQSTENCGAIKPIKNLNAVFDMLLNYYKNIPALSIAFAQGGDFIGGINNGKGSYRFNKRKCMNSFFCSTEREFKFVGAMNEDVNTYTTEGSRGNLFLTIPLISLTQLQTQTNSGGMSDMYLDSGTYIKSFYTLITAPNSTKIRAMGSKNKRLHHSVKWINAVPVIIREKYKK